MKLKNIHLENFRAFKELSVSFDERLTIFIGDNGAGKSSILDAISLFFYSIFSPEHVSNNEPVTIKPSDVYRNNKKNKPKISIAHTICDALVTIAGDFKNAASKKLTREDLLKLTKVAQEIRKGEMNNISQLMEFMENAGKVVINVPSAVKEFYSDKVDEAGNIHLPIAKYYSIKRNALWKARKDHSIDIFKPESIYNNLTSDEFEDFFYWFKSREDYENENFRMQLTDGDGNLNIPLQYDAQLTAVRSAIKAFFPQFSDISVRRSQSDLVLKKDDVEFSFNQLSGGERNFLALVADIARRLAIANPNSKTPLEGEGVVLIDEVELHLHPRWQKLVLPTLMDVFPNIQFIVSTHSPLVLTEVRDVNSIWVLTKKDGNAFAYHPQPTFGLTAAEVLEVIMGVHPRSEEVARLISEIMDLIDEDNFADARKKLNALKSMVNGQVSDIVRAETIISSLEPED